MPQTRRSRRSARAAVAAVGLTTAVTVIAMAGRAPLSRSTPVDAASVRAPVTALLMLLAGAGIVALAAVAALIWLAEIASRRLAARGQALERMSDAAGRLVLGERLWEVVRLDRPFPEGSWRVR